MPSLTSLQSLRLKSVRSSRLTLLRERKCFSAIPDIISGALYHHERYDGTGYPQGLKGDDIPLIARIICVADSYDAMSSFRCYRDALSKEEIMNELDVCAGKQFDPEIAAIMLDLIMSDAV